ncbi:hypothetical protein AC579_4577 [Pseudocercospora musae]|uniref:Uncharacterized protein n=1 Tax=Pseudocercospora musae TaxID=113226 RepID=A0A139ITE4_9PEZI|nr:hypothetical protein AC579_4577 [Pseudocercospora musae]
MSEKMVSYQTCHKVGFAGNGVQGSEKIGPRTSTMAISTPGSLGGATFLKAVSSPKSSKRSVVQAFRGAFDPCQRTQHPVPVQFISQSKLGLSLPSKFYLCASCQLLGSQATVMHFEIWRKDESSAVTTGHLAIVYLFVVVECQLRSFEQIVELMLGYYQDILAHDKAPFTQPNNACHVSTQGKLCGNSPNSITIQKEPKHNPMSKFRKAQSNPSFHGSPRESNTSRVAHKVDSI